MRIIRAHHIRPLASPDPYRRLAAAILLRAWRDAEAGDAEALAWLRRDGRTWLTILGIYTHLLDGDR